MTRSTAAAGRVLLALTMILAMTGVLAGALVGGTASPASAAGCGFLCAGNGGTGTGSPTAPPPPPPGGSTGGSGGTVSGCQTAICGGAGATSGVAYFPILPPGSPRGTTPYSGQCAGVTAFGGYIGVQYVYFTSFTDPTANLAQYTCIAPPSYTYTTVTCVWSLGAYATGPSNNPTVASTQFFTAAPVLSAFAAGGGSNTALCGGSFNRTFSANPPPDYGIYYITATGTMVNCTIRTYTSPDPRTGAVPAPQNVGCSPQYPIPSSQAAATVWCGGVQQGANAAHTFDPNECQGRGGTGGWTCTAGQPTVDGRAFPLHTLFADGTGHKIAWGGGAPAFAGAIHNVRSASSKLTVLPGSTPYRAGSTDPATQPFAMSPGYGYYQPGFVQDWTTQWFVNSDTVPTVAPWKAAVDYRFLGDFSGLTLQITGITVNAGGGPPTLQINGVPTTFTATGVCAGTPVSVVAQRTRSTN